jgi:hypothetical protein
MYGSMIAMAGEHRRAADALSSGKRAEIRSSNRPLDGVGVV